jgi:hypothetical protein
MTRLHALSALFVASLVFGGCATRPVNPPITQVDPNIGYRFETRLPGGETKPNLVMLAFSGGGTRAAAFSYDVLEFLRRTEVVGPDGKTVRLLYAVDAISGVSGASFTASAYGLYGDKLFLVEASREQLLPRIRVAPQASQFVLILEELRQCLEQALQEMRRRHWSSVCTPESRRGHVLESPFLPVGELDLDFSGRGSGRWGGPEGSGSPRPGPWGICGVRASRRGAFRANAPRQKFQVTIHMPQCSPVCVSWRQYERGNPSTCSATKDNTMFVEIGATW